MHYAILLISVLLGAAGQVLMKWGVDSAGTDRTFAASGLLRAVFAWPTVAGLACYAASLLFWLAALKRFPLSTAYPMVSLGYIAVMAAGGLLFHETVSLQKWCGAALIALGVLLIARS